MLGERLDYDAAETAGHNLTLVAPVHAGRSCYFCENCGAFVVAVSGIVRIWHHPRRDDYGCEPRQVARETLYSKIQVLDLGDWERLKGI